MSNTVRDFLKVIFMNNSGNVGKSTIAQHMFFPRLIEPELIRVETLNEDGIESGDKLSADDFDVIFTSLLAAHSNDVIVDVGSSNIETFQSKLENDFAGSHVFIDYFIIPVIPTDKQQRDTVNTINQLLIMGVDPDKIKVIFNRANPKKLIRDQFPYFVEKVTGLPNTDWENYPIINEVDLFKNLEKHKISFEELKNDDRDHMQLVREVSPAERPAIQMAHFFKMGYNAYANSLDKAFKRLNIIEEQKPQTKSKKVKTNE